MINSYQRRAANRLFRVVVPAVPQVIPKQSSVSGRGLDLPGTIRTNAPAYAGEAHRAPPAGQRAQTGRRQTAGPPVHPLPAFPGQTFGGVVSYGKSPAAGESSSGVMAILRNPVLAPPAGTPPGWKRSQLTHDGGKVE